MRDSKVAASASGTAPALSPDGAGDELGEDASSHADDARSSDTEEETNDFPLFVVDSKPDFKLILDENSDDDEEEPEEIVTGLKFTIDRKGKTYSRLSATADGELNAVEQGLNLQTGDSTTKSKADSDSLGLFFKHKENVKSGKKKEKAAALEAPCEIDVGFDLGDSYISLDGGDPASSKAAVENILLKSQKDKLIKNSVLTPDFEKRHATPSYYPAARQEKKRRKQERESSAGPGWFDMRAPEMTEELRNDIKVIRMRSTLDPKRFYKGNDTAALPKFVQVGTVVDSPQDFYHSRIPKKQRQQTLVEELLADADSRSYNKRKYMELQEKFRSFTRGGKKHRGRKKMGGKKR
ncbi:deoxynucleotidyltransferase terminal-interacting protein 2-like [Diadema antillarum]|uniref:deoxynucleotidyltransferase terminal-interacting protein 2-like n=1 Tax=Diadema antillarum TaxID=105358 RepID=UPI003A86A446